MRNLGSVLWCFGRLARRMKTTEKPESPVIYAAGDRDSSAGAKHRSLRITFDAESFLYGHRKSPRDTCRNDAAEPCTATRVGNRAGNQESNTAPYLVLLNLRRYRSSAAATKIHLCY